MTSEFNSAAMLKERPVADLGRLSRRGWLLVVGIRPNRVKYLLRSAGIAEKAFRDAFAALKPGGVLGVEEHRAAPGGVQDVLAANGYVQEAYVVRLAQEAGFVLDKTSEINANPADDRDHPFGVWTLPPVRLTAPRGEPADPNFDRTSYDAVGESDRMTLRLVKPAA